MEDLEVLRAKTIYERLKHHGFSKLDSVRLIYNTKLLKYLGKVSPHQLEIAERLLDAELAIISTAIAVHKALPHHVTPAKAEEVIDTLVADPHKHYTVIRKLRALSQLIYTTILPSVLKKHQNKESTKILEAIVQELNQTRNSFIKWRILDAEKQISKILPEDKIKRDTRRYRCWP